MKLLIRGWDQFWFAERSLFPLALFRIILCGAMFMTDLSRQFDLGNFYRDTGMVPAGSALELFGEYYRPPFAWFFWGDGGVFWAHSALVIGLLLLTLGLGGRLLNLICWILHIGFLQRNYSVAFGADVIGGVLLFLMIGTQSCGTLSLWSVIKRREKIVASDLFTCVFYRMIQIQLCLIYLYTGLEKLKGMTWWDGTALWSVLANTQMVTMDLSWLRHFPILIVLLTFSCVLFEIFFTPLIWNPQTRRSVLIAGVFFHLGIAFLMALMNFSVVMMAAYPLFLAPQEIKWLMRNIQGRLFEARA